jgi:exonuclease III
MILLSWNCRGLGNPRTVRDLHQTVKERRPNFVFLMETLCSKMHIEQLRVRLGFDSVFVVDPVGRSGGLALFWNVVDNLEIYKFSRRHIHAIVKDSQGKPFWKLTGFYGHPDCRKREESWAILRYLNSCDPTPWIYAGDFNEILDQTEKEGSIIRRESQMMRFREALEDCHLGDLGYQGSFFTWSNKRSDDSYTKERLDRAVANTEWCSIFPKVMVSVLAARTSDHSPLIISFDEDGHERNSLMRSFKFEAWWSNEVECLSIINSVWNEEFRVNASISDIQESLSACQYALKSWSSRRLGIWINLLNRRLPSW